MKDDLKEVTTEIESNNILLNLTIKALTDNIDTFAAKYNTLRNEYNRQIELNQKQIKFYREDEKIVLKKEGVIFKEKIRVKHTE